MFRRNWTPQDAEQWTKEDYVAIALSAIAYTNTLVGLALSCLFIPIGFVILALGLACAAYMFWIIDPKLKVISSEFENKQKEYLKRLEEIEEWKN